MTDAQMKLMRWVIEADRSGTTNDEKLIETGKFAGVHPRTVKSLEEAGLIVTDMPSWATEFTATHVRLPNARELGVELNQ